jgi:major type 1 subunit fimbrin (pilin)
VTLIQRPLLGCTLLITGIPTALAERLEITGELTPSTCVVQVIDGTVSVRMGKVDLASVNTLARAGQQNFSLHLDCRGLGAAQTVAVRFSGAPHGLTGNLALTPSSTATNVGVALYDVDGRHQKIDASPTTAVLIAANGQGRLDYSAWYAAPFRNATAGTANAQASVVVLYR